MSKYIKFNKVAGTVYRVLNIKGNDYLGDITYYERWKTWVFAPFGSDVIFDESCLQDIINFIKTLKPPRCQK